MKGVSILGSTGSIGTQTLEIVEEFPDRFRVVALTAGNNLDLLISQTARCREILARLVVRSKEDEARCAKMGIADLKRVYRSRDLAPGSSIIFAATAGLCRMACSVGHTLMRLVTAAMPASQRPRRSALYIPGSNFRALDKAASLDADVLRWRTGKLENWEAGILATASEPDFHRGSGNLEFWETGKLTRRVPDLEFSLVLPPLPMPDLLRLKPQYAALRQQLQDLPVSDKRRPAVKAQYDALYAKRFGTAKQKLSGGVVVST